MRQPVQLVVEGALDEAAARKIMDGMGMMIGNVRGLQGKTYILARISKYNQAARVTRTPWIILLDLDRDDECAPPFVQRLLPEPAASMRLRVAVRQLETWLLADRTALAAFLRVPLQLIPRDAEQERQPKQRIMKLMRRSRSKAIRDAVRAAPGAGIRPGIKFVALIREFIVHHWRPEVAALHSESLDRFIRAITTMNSSQG